MRLFGYTTGLGLQVTWQAANPGKLGCNSARV
jgi:hypothetical protein